MDRYLSAYLICQPAEQHHVQRQKFFIDEISITSEDFITIGSTGYATLYYSGRAIKIPTGLTAYTMKVENGKIVKSRAYSRPPP